MTMRLAPPKGMADVLPAEMALREWAQAVILNTYTDYGFTRIGTPAIEDAENLAGSEGGDNLNLIYQILKRGDKLAEAVGSGAQLWDLGLRYDLTLPLARFYAANREALPSPFKCVQIDRAYRAERPQKGRMRELTQCDIDILGDDSINAEAELIAVTAEALGGLGFTGFTARINDRRALRGTLLKFGFEEGQIASACVSFDKFDKIGAGGVADELSARNMPESAVAAFRAFMDAGDFSIGRVRALIGENAELDAVSGLIGELNAIGGGAWSAEYDLSLVRGQGYYTGMVFEMAYPGYGGSIAGGGRYDGMIGKFTGTPTPAVGFSIGFERIIDILREQNARPAQSKPKLAMLHEPGAPFREIFAEIQPLRGAYAVTAMPKPEKMGKLYKKLEREGYAFVRLPGEPVKPV